MTNLKNNHVEFPAQNKIIKEKQEKSCLKNYGTKYPAQNEQIKEKIRQTCNEKYGGNSPTCNKKVKEKQEQKLFNNYGVLSPLQNKVLLEKFKQTCFEHYGVNHPMQDPGVFKKQKISSFEIKYYKNTDLTYQAGYEKYFLEQMDKCGFLNELSMGKSYNYVFDEKLHVYHSDYLFKDITIEIKSEWSYNRDGTDQRLQLENELKWQTVKNNGDNLIILWSENEIKNLTLIQYLCKRLV